MKSSVYNASEAGSPWAGSGGEKKSCLMESHSERSLLAAVRAPAGNAFLGKMGAVGRVSGDGLHFLPLLLPFASRNL